MTKTVRPSAESPGRATILGLPVDRVTMGEALDRIQGFLREPFAKTHLVITADAAGMVQAQSDEEHRALFAHASLITPDSVGVLWASRRVGTPITERVSGVDLVDRLCALSAEHGYRIFFLGAAPGVAELAAERMRLVHPGCNIVGARHGYFPADSDMVVAEEVAQASPDILFVAMGIPRQEKFIAATADLIQAKVAMGVGGSFDVFSGRAKRAPKLIQAMHLEWLWRTLTNPKKIAKAKFLPKFIQMVLRSPR